MKQAQATLRIKPHFSIIPHSAHQVELRSGVWNPTSFIINDESNSNKLYAILKDLSGDLTIPEMAKKHQVSREEMEGIVDHLQRLNVIEYSTSESTPYYMEHLIAPSPDSSSHLENILVIGEDYICHEIERILINTNTTRSVSLLDVNDRLIRDIKNNVQWMFDSFALQEAVDKFSCWKEHFVVLALTRNDPLVAMRLNQINHILGIPWIHGVIDGPFIFIGPSFISKSGPCYHCFEKRITMNLHEYASYQRYKEMLVVSDLPKNNVGKTSPTMYLLASHLAMEIINYRFLKTCFTRSKALSIYLPTMEICFNEVLRLSGCPVCGSVPHRDDQQLYYDYQTILENVDHD
ncbi:MAG: hypothetical protein K0S27_541 [Gammaproteobacteria bacterium]|jgi:thiazole/oxazole-forming peptide maturase SagC family component|nr:hypothetical protein [Gammaproteobacteria bacterium]